MVPVEYKSEFQLRISRSQKLIAFNNLLSGILNPVESPQVNEPDEIYSGLINALQKDDRASFITYYEKKNRSHPNQDFLSPFVNDDYIIFCITLGIMKFNLDKKWIKEIIALRKRNPITITFENILSNDFYSNSNVNEVIIVFLNLSEKSLINNDLLSKTYKCINQNPSLFNGKNDFQAICAINAESVIIDLKISPSGSEISLLRRFNTKFLKRIKVITWFFQTLIFMLIFYALIKLLSVFPIINEFFEKFNPIFNLLGIFGISLLGNFFPALNKMMKKTLLWIFGYPKELVSNEK